MNSETYAPDLPACRERQQRLLAEMQKLGLNLAILTRGESVQWLTGLYLGPLFSSAATIDDSGHVTLVLPNRKMTMPTAADEMVGYEAKWHSTFRSDQRAASNEVLFATLKQRPARVGGEWSCLGPQLLREFGGAAVDIEPALFELRRQKHPDELRMMVRANDANRAMYTRAREIIRPGINELDLYSELQATAVRELGEPLTYFGQDFQCCSRGGPPRNRPAEGGELFILDLGVGFRGYYSDNARTIAVDRSPTDAQQRAWEKIAEVFPLVEAKVRPGVSCRELFETVQTELAEAQPWVFNHHLGHGVGLAPHEGPHLNPRWDDRFEVGDFFTVEPGLYHDQLRQGIRLEQNYIVTSSGVELLTDYPLGL